jgi:hypothetical protein
MLKQTLVGIGLLATMAGPCFAGDIIEFSLVGKLGYLQPLGEWTAHRYAPGVDQFQGSYTVAPEFEVKIGDIGISVLYVYSSLSTAEWEDYVSGQGGGLSASGSLSQLGGVVKYYLIDTERNAVHIEGGLSYLFLNGNEQYRGFDYEYDFLKSGLGFLAGAGYEYAFNEQLSAVTPVRFLWRPEGIKYPEGKADDIFGLLLMVGLKLTF